MCRWASAGKRSEVRGQRSEVRRLQDDLSSVFCLLSSVFCLLSSVFCLLSSLPQHPHIPLPPGDAAGVHLFQNGLGIFAAGVEEVAYLGEGD